MVKSNFNYEEIYALRIMQYEKEMASKNRRPPLPVNMMHKYSNTAPAALEMRKTQKKVRDAIYRDVMNAIDDGEVIDLKSLKDKTMSEMTREQAMDELADIVRCRCREAYTGRGLRDPECQCDSVDAVKTVANHIAELKAENKRLNDLLDDILDMVRR